MKTMSLPISVIFPPNNSTMGHGLLSPLMFFYAVNVLVLFLVLFIITRDFVHSCMMLPRITPTPVALST